MRGLRRHRSGTGHPPLRIGFTLVELLAVIAIIGLLVGLLLPAVQLARESARRGVCAGKIKQVALAIAQYEHGNGTFPPAYVGSGICSSSPPPALSYLGESGVLNTSGLVLMLSQLNAQSVSEKANLRSSFGTYKSAVITGTVVSTPFNNRNAVVALTRLPTLECPTAYAGNSTNPSVPTTLPGITDTSLVRFVSASNTAGAEYGRSTNYLLASSKAYNSVCDGWRKGGASGITGAPGTRYAFGEESFARPAVILDGLSNVFAVYETLSGKNPSLPFQGVPWAYYNQDYQGYDSSGSATINDWDATGGPGYLSRRGEGAGSSHPGGCHFAFADGRVQFVSEVVAGTVLDALFQTGDNIDAANGLSPVDQLE
jgi:prepilin-type N-terminal cleavage/methylation domain-containing protein/prepilin-type processing-associated H-X9-DG protein